MRFNNVNSVALEQRKLELIFLVGFIMSVGSVGSFGLIIITKYLATVVFMIVLEIKFGVLSWPV